MIKRKLLRIISVCAAMIFAVGGMYAPNSPLNAETVITASAAYNYVTPVLRQSLIHGDKLALTVANIDSYSDDVRFDVYVTTGRARSISAAALKRYNGLIELYTDGELYLKPETAYKIRVYAFYPDNKWRGASVLMCTTRDNYFTVYKGARMYTYSGGKLTYAATAPSNFICRGVMTNSLGYGIAGRTKAHNHPYVRLTVPVKNGVNENNEQLYKYVNYYIDYDLGKTCSRYSMNHLRANVVNYALAMSRKSYQRYELCGEIVGASGTISDCSGLTKLSYLNIGYYMEHAAGSQAEMGGKVIYDNTVYTGTTHGVRQYRFKNPASRVNYSALRQGDLLFFLCSTNDQETDPTYVSDGIGHVAMYIGGGKMVHFTSSYGLTNHPCRIEDLASYERNSLVVAKAVRYII